MKQLDILENSRHTIQLDNIIGGQDFEHLSKPIYKVVESVSNSGSIDPFTPRLSTDRRS